MFVVLIACSQIGLSQTEKTYVVDIQGNAMKFESESKLINLCFDADVPELTDQQVSQLLKDRKIERFLVLLSLRTQNLLIFKLSHLLSLDANEGKGNFSNFLNFLLLIKYVDIG